MCDFIVQFRIAAVPPFPGLRRFPEGRNFKQWTGDDSKALMKVGVLLCYKLWLLDRLQLSGLFASNIWAFALANGAGNWRIP